MFDKDSRRAMRELQDVFDNAPPAEWVVQMIEHHRRTRSYRPQDLRRLLGDPTQGVESGPNVSLTSQLSEWAKKNADSRSGP